MKGRFLCWKVFLISIRQKRVKELLKRYLAYWIAFFIRKTCKAAVERTYALKESYIEVCS